MFINIGEDCIVWSKEIIAIINIKDIKDSSPLLIEFFSHHQEKVIDLSNGLGKSMVITKDKIFLSPLSTLTLKRRQMEIS